MTFTWEHVLYRFYDENGTLLYVGITNSINTRFKAHVVDKSWWPEVADCRIAFYPDRAALARAEGDAIKYEHPCYNVRQEGSALPRKKLEAGGYTMKRKPLESRRRPTIAPCISTDTTKPIRGCTCRSRAQHFGLPEGSVIPEAWLQPDDSDIRVT